MDVLWQITSKDLIGIGALLLARLCGPFQFLTRRKSQTLLAHPPT